jgi:hypothetical protein
MRGVAIILIISLAAIAAGAQVAPVASVFYAFRNSVIDHGGRLLIFDASYVYPPFLAGPSIPVRFPPTVTTRVTLIDSTATNKQDAQYDGTFQVVGVGRYAVYAIITSYAASGIRQLVALGPKFPTLPSMDVPLQTDVKVSVVGDGVELDTIALVDNAITPLAGVFSTGAASPLSPVPIQPRTVKMFRSDGTSFTPLPPVVLSNP